MGHGIQGKTRIDGCVNECSIVTEFIDGVLAGYLGEVLVRCNNVLYIKAAEEQLLSKDGDDDDHDDSRMAE